MTPKEFHHELLNLPKVNDRFLDEVRVLREKYPYFQALTLIIALGAKHRSDPTAANALHTAAAYSADRGLLKEQMSAASPILSVPQVLVNQPVDDTPTSDTFSNRPVVEVKPSAENTTPEPSAVAAAPVVAVQPQNEIKDLQATDKHDVFSDPSALNETDQSMTDSIGHDSKILPGEFAERVMAGLGELKERMTQFTRQTNASAKHTGQPSADSQEIPSATAPAKSDKAPTEADKKEKKQPSQGSKDPSDKLLDEIKSKRKRQKPDSERQVEQMELIDKFISNKPSRRPTRKTTTEKTPAPSGAPEPPAPSGQENYSENVISETLVDLLIRQGKREKAIEVLRKLIWKFPQKKALFAARIQELSQ